MCIVVDICGENMGRMKLYDVVVNISISSTMANWIDDMVKSGKFSSRSHGVRRCIGVVMNNPEVMAKL